MLSWVSLGSVVNTRREVAYTTDHENNKCERKKNHSNHQITQNKNCYSKTTFLMRTNPPGAFFPYNYVRHIDSSGLHTFVACGRCYDTRHFNVHDHLSHVMHLLEALSGIQTHLRATNWVVGSTTAASINYRSSIWSNCRQEILVAKAAACCRGLVHGNS